MMHARDSRLWEFVKRDNPEVVTGCSLSTGLITCEQPVDSPMKTSVDNLLIAAGARDIFSVGVGYLDAGKTRYGASRCLAGGVHIVG